MTRVLAERRLKPSGDGLGVVRTCLGIVCALLLFAMMALTVADVVGRYLLSSPVPGASELTELLLSGVIFIGLPAIALDDGHVTVDLLTERLPGWTWPIILMLARAISAVVLVLIAWRLFAHGRQLQSYGEVSIYLHLPVAPVAYLAAAFTLFAAGLTASLMIWRPARVAGSSAGPVSDVSGRH